MGTGTPRPDPNNPGVAVNGTRYLRPLLYINYNGGNGTAELDLVAVDVMPAGAVSAVSIADGAITADKLSTNAITGKVITGGTFYTRSAAPRVEMGETAYEGGAIASIKWDLQGKGWDEPTIQANVLTGGKRRFQIRGPQATEGVAGVILKAEDTDYSWRMLCWSDPLTAITSYGFTPAARDRRRSPGTGRGRLGRRNHARHRHRHQPGRPALGGSQREGGPRVHAGLRRRLAVVGGRRAGAHSGVPRREAGRRGLPQPLRGHAGHGRELPPLHRNSTSSDVAADFELRASSNTGTVDAYASAGQPRGFALIDVGDADDFPLAATV
ncbi:hypothetical protein [Micromonospora chersina]|uniref:hypothetical protein n=1 Tax=Micromonospora chersina TaxID=47854 RepID=UPI0033B6AFB2